MNLLLLLSFVQDDSSDTALISAITLIFLILVILAVMRLFGAWMFRINDVIDELKKVNRKLSKMEKQLNKDSE